MHGQTRLEKMKEAGKQSQLALLIVQVAYLLVAQVCVGVVLVMRIEGMVANYVQALGRNGAPVARQDLVEIFCQMQVRAKV